MLSRRYLAVIVIGLAVGPAEAQTPSSPARTFIDFTVGPDWDDVYSTTTRASGATPRVGFAWGVDWGSSGLEIGASVADWHVKELGLYRYQFGGPSFGWQRQGSFYESSTTVRRRSIDLVALYRASVPVHRKVTVTWGAGGGYAYRPQQSTRVTHEVVAGAPRAEVDVTRNAESHNYLVAAARLDVEFRVAPRVSVVPRVRLTLFPAFADDSSLAPRVLTARPEVAVRWQF